VKSTDIIAVREKSKSMSVISDSLSTRKETLEWLEWNESSHSGKILSVPMRAQIPENIKEQLIVELYSK
jgi:small subunit ribosomal protein S4